MQSAESKTCYRWVPISIVLSVLIATGLTMVFIFPFNEAMSIGITDQGFSKDIREMDILEQNPCRALDNPVVEHDDLLRIEGTRGRRQEMKTKDWLYRALITIGTVTVLSGLSANGCSQCRTPIASEATPTSLPLFCHCRHVYGPIRGSDAQAQPLITHSSLFWASFQKFGAWLAVVLGVLRLLFSPLALFVAGFDLL